MFICEYCNDEMPTAGAYLDHVAKHESVLDDYDPDSANEIAWERDS